MNKRDLILNTMRELFKEGTAGTASVSDIAKRAGIAKGGLYYYFHSKEEVMDALVEREYKDKIDNCKQLVMESNENALDKFKLLYNSYSNSYVDSSLDEYLHMPQNAAIHQKSLATILISLSAIVADIIKQGIDEGIFTCEYPEEYAEFLLTSLSFLLDPGIFTWSKQQILAKLRALADIFEKGLCTEKGNFSFLYEKRLDKLTT